jgi:hypothetical protein
MTGLTHRGIVRITTEIDRRTRRPFVLRLELGGQLVRIRTAGSRSWLTVTVGQIWQLACDTEARRKRLEKYQARLERRKQRRDLS